MSRRDASLDEEDGELAGGLAEAEDATNDAHIQKALPPDEAGGDIAERQRDGDEDAAELDANPPLGKSRADRRATAEPVGRQLSDAVVAESVEAEGPAELFEFRLQICAYDAAGKLVAVHTKCERDETFPSRNTVKVASHQTYVLVFQVANTRVPFDSLLAVRVADYDVPITKQLRSNNEFVCEGRWDTAEISPTGNGFRIQMPVRVAYLLGNEKYCRETEFILQMKVYDAKDAKKAQQGGTPLDCISCKFYRNSSRSVNYPTFLRT